MKIKYIVFLEKIKKNERSIAETSKWNCKERNFSVYLIIKMSWARNLMNKTKIFISVHKYRPFLRNTSIFIYFVIYQYINVFEWNTKLENLIIPRFNTEINATYRVYILSNFWSILKVKKHIKFENSSTKFDKPSTEKELYSSKSFSTEMSSYKQKVYVLTHSHTPMQHQRLVEGN